jgi:hypothetical protein
VREKAMEEVAEKKHAVPKQLLLQKSRRAITWLARKNN